MSNRLTSSGMEEKALQIAACLAKNPVDLWELRELALSRGGLLKGKLRQEAWAKLVGLSDSNKNENSNSNSNSNYDPLGAEDEEQEYQRQRQRRKSSSPTASHEEKTIDIALEVDLIRKDVGRSVIFRFRNNERDDWSVATPSGQSSEEEAPKFDKVCCDRLAQVLERTILEPMAGQWHYYQGLHDIAGVLLHNMDYDVKKSTTILRRVCQSHLRDALRENFKSVTWLLDVLLLPLVEQMEPHVHYALLVSEVEMSNVCLPWLITWFTHDIHDRVVAARMVDAFVAGHPLLPFYVAVALLTHPLLKHQIVNADANDPASIFPILKQLPFGIVSDTTTAATPVEDGHTTTVVAQELIEDAISIMHKFPPRSLFNLVDPETCPRPQLMERMSSVSMFKAPASWSISAMSSAQGYRSTDTQISVEMKESNIRAKVASGVSILMRTVPKQSVEMNGLSWGSKRHVPPRPKRSKWQKYKRMFLKTRNNIVSVA